MTLRQVGLFSLSPLDGRYAAKTSALAEVFSEAAFFKYRIIVEIRWLQMLASCGKVPGIPAISMESNLVLEGIIQNFSERDAEEVKRHEQQTNHDVKAVEYFIKGKIGENAELAQLVEFVHFGCTSEDINNLAYGMMILKARNEILLPALIELVGAIDRDASEFGEHPMPARTHGQLATPTTMGKEFRNFAERLREQVNRLYTLPIKGKLNGAVGNYNALMIAFPGVNWEDISQEFVTKLGLTWNGFTTQIEPHDYIVDLFDNIRHINNILIGFCRDIWAYCGDKFEYFNLKHAPGETGSSTMPHKINPIDFENAEGNLGVADALMVGMSEKLPISRLQRDLSDSTVLRNMGTVFGYAIIAYGSLVTGLGKLKLNPEKMLADLKPRWELLGEPIQTVMRAYGIPQAYEKVKELMRGNTVTRESVVEFIEAQPLPPAVKQRLLDLTPETYLGDAVRLAKKM